MVWLLPFIGLIAGAVLGICTNIIVPAVFAQYLSVLLLSAVDSLIGGYLGILEKKFDGLILFTGFIFNTLLGGVFIYLGNHLGVDLFIAVVFVFIFRIFNNFGIARRLIIQRQRHKKRKRPNTQGGGRFEE